MERIHWPEQIFNQFFFYCGIVLCQGCFPGNPLLCHSPRHPKLLCFRHTQNLGGALIFVSLFYRWFWCRILCCVTIIFFSAFLISFFHSPIFNTLSHYYYYLYVCVIMADAFVWSSCFCWKRSFRFPVKAR